MCWDVQACHCSIKNEKERKDESGEEKLAREKQAAKYKSIETYSTHVFNHFDNLAQENFIPMGIIVMLFSPLVSYH